MIVLGIVILLLVLLAILKVGILAEYSGGELSVRLIVGPLRLSVVVPESQKMKMRPSRKKKRLKTPEETAKDAAEETKHADIGKWKQLFPGIRMALSRIGRKLVVDELTVHYLAAGDDPCDTALAFGRATAGINGAVATLDNFLTFRKRDIQTAIDFDAEHTTVYGKAAVTLRVWQAVGIGASFLLYYLKNSTSGKEERKITEYGKVE